MTGMYYLNQSTKIVLNFIHSTVFQKYVNVKKNVKLIEVNQSLAN